VIDWVLASPHWIFDSHRVIPTDLSDHRMVVTDLRRRAE
jgi:hypothetical protein